MFDRSASYMLTVIASVYGILVYTIAFALEIWLIFTSDNFDEEYVKNSSSSSLNEIQYSASIAAFVQAALYFVVVIVSLFLILGLIIKSIVCLLCWMIAIVLIFFPECALVLHTSLNVWKIDTRNGQIELCFYVVRAIMNIFFLICVQNLVTQWKAQKNVTNYINRETYNGFPCIATTSITSKNARFVNTPYLDNIDSISLNGLYNFNTLGYTPNYDYLSRYKPNPLNAITSEFDTQNFRDYMLKKNIYLNDLLQNNENYQNKNFSTQSLDRRAYQKTNNPTSNNVKEVILRPLSTKPFDYLYRPGSVLNLNMMYNYESNENFNNIVNEKKDAYDNVQKNEKGLSGYPIRDVAL